MKERSLSDLLNHMLPSITVAFTDL